MLKNNKVKGVAIVGAGIIYDKHARALASMPDRARLIGVAEIDEAKHAAACKGTFVPVLTRDYHELLPRDDDRGRCSCS